MKRYLATLFLAWLAAGASVFGAGGIVPWSRPSLSSTTTAGSNVVVTVAGTAYTVHVDPTWAATLATTAYAQQLKGRDQTTILQLPFDTNVNVSFTTNVYQRLTITTAVAAITIRASNAPSGSVIAPTILFIESTTNAVLVFYGGAGWTNFENNVLPTNIAAGVSGQFYFQATNGVWKGAYAQ